MTAIAAALPGGFLADLAADWYRIPGMEGQAGYFVVFMILLALVVGFVLGFGLSLFLTRKPGGGLRALWMAPLLAVLCVAAIGVTARLLADVPPRYRGEALLLQVELSWPLAQAPQLPLSSPDPGWRIQLASLSGRTVRAIEAGAVWTDDAYSEDGRLIVPAAVEIFTSRGGRLLLLDAGGDETHGFLVPLPAFPGEAQTRWSEWLPRAAPAAAELPQGLRYRFRILRRSEPVRSETLGPFAVDAVATGFAELVSQAGARRMQVYGDFQVRHRGTPVAVPAQVPLAGGGSLPDHFHAVAVLPTEPPSLVVQADPPWSGGRVFLLSEADGELRVDALGSLNSDLVAFSLDGTKDTSTASTRDGRVNRNVFSRPGLFAVAQSVLDTRVPAARQIHDPDALASLDRLPPLSLAPDQSRFARMWRESERLHLVQVDLASGERQEVPFRHARVPSGDRADADRDWFEHHFEWQCAADQACSVAEKPEVQPLPRRGQRSGEGRYREYHLRPSTPELRERLADYLVEEMAGVRLEPGSGWAARVRVEGVVIHLIHRDEEAKLTLWAEEGGERQVVESLADRLDAALAEGRFEGAFATTEAR
ncbi:MAG TPA: hypothetical protein PKZ76_08780 [Xanthomonadaceae bacterium]|nr:hypothetical protein [Xanthomonadaceae bacterium]